MSLAFYIGIETESGKATHPHFDPEEAVTVFTFIEAVTGRCMSPMPSKKEIERYELDLWDFRDTVDLKDLPAFDAYCNRFADLIEQFEEYEKDGQSVFIYIA